MCYRLQKYLSSLLLAGGVFLLFWGAREYIGSRTGQSSAAREFENALSRPSPRAPIPIPTPHRGDTVAKLLIPRLDAELYVLEGDDAAELRRGPGHITGTALPGSLGNCVIAGHRDTHFRLLKDIREGDDIVLQTSHGEFLYRVRAAHVISPKNVSVLDPTPDSELSLITCFPFYYVGSAPERFLVEARLAGSIRPAS